MFLVLHQKKDCPQELGIHEYSNMSLLEHIKFTHSLILYFDRRFPIPIQI